MSTKLGSDEVDAVTGVGGFTGRYIARRLLDSGRNVINLTGHPDRPTGLGDVVRSMPFAFDSPDRITQSLEGVSTLFNTYWIRLERGAMTFEKAIENSKALVEAAVSAGVRRIVHISVLNPSADSPFSYYRGKAVVEEVIRDSGLSYAILRPAVIFGDSGVLINNIAWFLRRFPVFAIPGSGDYSLQPVYVDDLAKLAVALASSSENVVMDAVGPEVFTLNELVALIRRTVGSHTRVIHAPPNLALIATGLIGLILRDVILTRDEIASLSANLLVSNGPPTCPTRLSDWLASNADSIGQTYMRDLRK
ncbi:MAG: NAD(P)H-binding protein [Armatimonadetes bacterium]|nr:NAD(P)H-binding protein [Armatimonadota bacterium]